MGRKIIIDAIEDDNEDIYNELFEFFSSIQKRSFQRIINDNHDINDGDIIIEIQNPIK